MLQSSLTAWLKGSSSETKNELRDYDPPPPPLSTAPFSNPQTSSPFRQNGNAPRASASSSSDETLDQQQRQLASLSPCSSELRPTTNLPAFPHKVRFRPCTSADVPALKRLNALLLPIPYPDVFYRETVQDPIIHHLTILAFWCDGDDDDSSTGDKCCHLVGAIRGCLLPNLAATTKSSMTASTRHAQSKPYTSEAAAQHQTSHEDDGPMLYLSTLALLSPYRAHGIATYLLQAVLRRAVSDHAVRYVGAHVWEANTEGRAWYRRRGFREISRETGYYRRLSPSDAVVVRREVSVLDLVNGVWE